MRLIIRFQEATRSSPDADSYKVLSGRNRRLLRRKRGVLQRNINPEGQLIDACISLGVITHPDAELIRAEGGDWKRQVRLMIKCLKRRPESAIEGFRRALEATNQQHVAEALRGNDENLMNDYHKNILKASRDVLVKNVNTEGHLLDALLSNGAITHCDAELIRDERRNGWKAQGQKLHECLLRRPDTAFDGFIKGLLLTDQQHLANQLLENGLHVTVRLNLKRKHSDDDSDSSSSMESGPPDDIRTTINRLINDGLLKIQDQLKRKRRKATAIKDELEMVCVERLVGLLENFNRQILSAQIGSIVLTILCVLRESVWDLKWLCHSELFLQVCRSFLIPIELQALIDVEVTVDEVATNRCVGYLDEYLPPPFSPLVESGSMPTEIRQMILHRVLSFRETGKVITAENLALVCQEWNTVLHDDRFRRAYKRFVESSMKPYLFFPRLLETRISPPFGHPKAIIGVCILRRKLYVARAETHLIEVYDIPEIASYDVSTTSVPDHVFLRALDLINIEMPFNMASSETSNCLYVTDFARNVGCVWLISPDVATEERKFTDNVGRPIGISVSRDNYVIVVSENPNCVRVFSRFAESVLTIQLPLELEAPRQAICTEPGRFALIHGYLEPLNRVVEIDGYGRVIRSYGSTLGSGYEQIHWPAALIFDGHGRMMVGDRENRRIHLVDRNFRLKRHLVQLDRQSAARPRRLCLDDQNGVLYIGHTDENIKVYRVSYPSNISSNEKSFSKGINCFRAAERREESLQEPAQARPGQDALVEKPRYVMPPCSPYRAITNFNEIPVEFLQTIFLKAAAMEKQSKLQSTLVRVCRKWYNIVGVMHFRYRLVRFVKGHKEHVKRQETAASENLETPQLH